MEECHQKDKETMKSQQEQSASTENTEDGCPSGDRSPPHSVSQENFEATEMYRNNETPSITCDRATQTLLIKQPKKLSSTSLYEQGTQTSIGKHFESCDGSTQTAPTARNARPVPDKHNSPPDTHSSSNYAPPQSDNEASVVTWDGTVLDAMSLQVIRSQIRRDPSRYIGVSPQHMWIVSLLAEKITYENRGQNLNKEDVVFMTLMRVRQDIPNHLLADFFGVSKSTVSRLLSRALPEIGNCLGELVSWPERQVIRDNLPHSFLANFSRCESIIDCFEVEIEKPSLAVSQSMSWSEYKKVNSVKYLISATPDGLINFVSGGRPGRASDMDLVRSSGYLDCLRSESTVLADRGFKELETELTKHGCSLVRPPSVRNNEKLEADEVVRMRTIAGLRIHIERVIARVRVYKMLAMHSRIPLSMADLLDSIVKIACGLANLHERIVKS